MSEPAERIPSLRLVREVSNLEVDQVLAFEDTFRDMVEDEGVDPAVLHAVHFYYDDPYTAEVLGAGELIEFHRRFDLDFHEDSVTRLGRHLDDALPDLVDEELRVPTYPATLLPRGNRAQTLMSLGTGRRVMLERIVAQSHISKYYGIDVPYSEQWSADDRNTRVRFARIRMNRIETALPLMNRIFAQKHILPEVIEYDPLSIDDVDISS